jgi:hypothetical protein
VQFLIADTFRDSLGRLTGDEQKLAKTTAFGLQLNPVTPGDQCHRLDKARDRNFWSVRVNADVRLIVHRSEQSLLLCYVDHHDKAYDWAERRKLETHPRTGAAQFVEVRTTVKDVVVRNAVPAQADTERLPKSQASRPLANLTDGELLAVGVPPDRIDDLRAANEALLEVTIANLPTGVRDTLLDYATGGSLPQSAPAHVATEVIPPHALVHPDARRHFRVVISLEELERVLEGTWGTVTAALSPTEAVTSVAARVANARNLGERAERLFVWLLENNRLVTYGTAFELLFEEKASPFRNAVHVRPVLDVAQRTAARSYGGLEVRLDSLVVSKADRRPGEGHFRTALYTPDEWATILGTWPLI